MVRWCLLGGFGAAVVVAAMACSSSSNNAPGGDGDGGITAADHVSHGSALVDYYGCKRCHGNDMAGQTTPVQINNPPPCVQLFPPNLTPDNATGIGAWTDDQLQGAIIDGVDNTGETLCPEMRHYKDAGTDDVSDIIAYLRSLPAVSKTIPGSICPPLKGSCTGQ